MMIRPRLFVRLVLLVLTATSADAQSEDGIRYGLGLDLALNIHTAKFNELPGTSSCCPEYTGGAGLGLVFGPVLDLPAWGGGRVLVRPAWYLRNGTLSEEEQSTVILNGRPTQAVFEHVIDARLSTVGGEVLGAHWIGGGVRLLGGVRLGAVVASSFDTREELLEPEGAGTFENGRRTRNEYSGEIPGAQQFDAGAILGLDVTIPWSADGSTSLTAALLYSHDLTRVTDAVPWRTSGLRLGAGVMFGPRRSSPPLATDPIEAPSRRESADTAGASIVAVAIEPDGSERSSVVINVEEFISINMRPLLNYVFFDEGSAVIPQRYVRRRSGDTSFDDRALHGLDPIATYREVLNIFGYRMTLFPQMPLVLTGTTAGSGPEAGDLGLARARALAVRDYISRTWGVDTSRFRIRALTVPENPSDTTTEDGRAENRRVEIVSGDLRVMEPVITRDTLRRVTPPLVRLRPNSFGRAPIESWRIEVEQGDAPVARFGGAGLLPPWIDWETNRDQQLAPRSDAPLTVSLEVQSAAGPVGARTQLPVELVTIRRKREERVGDRVIDRYRLILFGFDRADLDEVNFRLAGFIGAWIRPGSTVTVTGHTDRTGDEQHNLDLSLARARSTSEAIGVPDASVAGLGETPLLYDNELPEGRFYSRTVQVVVERREKWEK